LVMNISHSCQNLLFPTGFTGVSEPILTFRDPFHCWRRV